MNKKLPKRIPNKKNEHVAESPGARESNAGDDFHILWAARKAVKMLAPNSLLQRIFVEKVSPLDTPEPFDNDDYFLGVDLTEYYKGNDFTSASSTVASQLKYSTRHPEREWTASRLCSVGKSKTPVIRRLADVYRGYSKQSSRDTIISKLGIRLVSNQPVSSELEEALESAKKALTSFGKTSAVTTANLLKKLSVKSCEVIETLRKASGLGSNDFTDFLRILDLSGCGTETRAFQRLRLIQELSPMVSANPLAAMRDLRELISNETQPEKRLSRGLVAEDVIAALGVSHKDDLFPAQSHLRSPDRVIQTGDARKLAEILESETKPVLAHGDAGVGKTTTVGSLVAHLPVGSVVIIYDCYGGGNYLVAGEQRHTNNRAFMQLTNEMALRCGTPFLVQPARERYDLHREFRRALDSAAKIVAADGGLLVIAVDAADNAIVAALATGDGDCFVSPLWTIMLPPAARLLMTSRSHRRESLAPPPEIVEYELRGFDATASTEHLRTIFSEADELSAAIFHDRTGGNPRVQFYLLNRAQSGKAADGAEESLADLLEVSKRTPHDIFNDLLDAAVKHAPFGDDSRRMLAALVCLARPLPLNVFANACGVKLKTARDFCRALIPGLILEEDEISLRDEDFETFLSGEVGEDERLAAHARLADYFMPLSLTDSYAARAVAEHLYQAERFEDVINLAINEMEPAAVRDQMQRLDVYRRRVELALLAAEKLGRDAEAVRLTMLAAELSRSDAAIASLVRENPELAALYGDAASVARIYKREETEDWFGAVHLRTAGLYAHDPAQHDRAREQLRLADAWLRRRMSLPEHLRNRWDLSARDVAAGAEAVFWLNGAEAAKDWLIRWRPPEFVLNIAGILGASLAPLLTADEIRQHLSELTRLPPRVMALLLGSIWRAGGSPPPELVRETAEKIDRVLKREADFQRRWRERRLGREEEDAWVVSFCELTASSGADSALVLRLTKALCPPMPETTPQRRWSYPYYDPLRAACLEAALTGGDVTTSSLMPERFRHKAGENQYHFDSERRAFGEVIGKVIEIYKLRARALAASLTITDAASAIRKNLDSYRVDSEHRWFKGDFQYLNWAKRATETLLLAETGAGDATERENILRDIADLAERVAPDGAAWLWKDMAEMLARRDECRPLAYHLLERATLRVAEQRVRAQERWELLLRCSEIARRYDDALGRDYYGRALSAAEGVNDDNLTLLSLQSRLARKVVSFSTSDERREFAAHLSRNLASHEDFVSERSRLPWEQTVGAVTRLDPASGASLCSRWDDENLLDVDDGIVPFVEEAAGSGFLPPLAGLNLLRLAKKHFDVSESAVELLDLLAAAGTAARPNLVWALRRLSDWIKRDLPVKRRRTAARRIVEWATAHGAGQFVGIAELRALESFAAGIKSSEDTENNYSYRGDEENKKPTIEELFAEARTGSLENLDARLDTVWRRDHYRVAEFLVTVGRSVAPNRRAEFLAAIVALESERIFAQYVAKGLGQLLREWRNFAPVREWTEKGGIEAFFRNHLPSLVVYEHNAADNLSTVLSAPQIVGQPRTKFLLPAVIKHFETLGAGALYLLAETLAETIEGADLRDVFEWSLDRTERRLEADGAFKNAAPPVITPPFDDCPAVLARFLWSLFGHPDKTVRWRALHAARGIFLAPPLDATDRDFKRRLLDELIGQINISEVGAFRSERADFYPLSARVWLLVLLERLTSEVPDEITPHAATLRDLAVDKTLPHAQAREIARRAFLRIAELRPSAVTPEMADEVARANRPASCFYPRGKYRDSRYEKNTSDAQNAPASTRRFNFDSMDTLPYWYSNVSQIFGEPPKNAGVIARAERWICDRWGRSESDWWKDPRELGERYKWQEMMNRHGSVPPIENLRTYLEYHAMFCGAGEMVDELPVNVTGWDDEEMPACPWEEWIAEHVAADSDGWLSDLRSPTPHRADCWGDFPPIDEWLKPRDAAEYDAELGLDETEHKGEIMVCGNITLGDSYRRGSIRVSSSLVNPETALSLLRALQTASNPHDFMLPVESRGSGDMEIDEGEFELKAWLDDRRIEKGLEGFDSLARGVRGSFTTFSKDFLATMNIRRERGTRHYHASDGKRIARLEIWNDNEEEETERITEPFSEGERLWLRIDALLEYLRLKERDLIIEVQIERRERREHNENNEEYDLGKSRIYLLRRNGQLETMDGNRQIG